MSASTTNLPSNPAGVAARLSTNGAFWLGRSGLLLGARLLGDRGDGLAGAGRSVGHCGGVRYRYAGRGRGTVADGRGVVGGCWENRGPTHLCTQGAGCHRATFLLLTPLFSFIYALIARTPCTPNLVSPASLPPSPYTARPASRNRSPILIRQSAALTRRRAPCHRSPSPPVHSSPCWIAGCVSRHGEAAAGEWKGAPSNSVCERGRRGPRARSRASSCLPAPLVTRLPDKTHSR